MNQYEKNNRKLVGRLRFIGFSVRCSKNASLEKTNTCETPEPQLTPQLTPDDREENEVDTQNTSPDLADIIGIWPQLPPHIKAAIKALIQAHNAAAE